MLCRTFIDQHGISMLVRSPGNCPAYTCVKTALVKDIGYLLQNQCHAHDNFKLMKIKYILCIKFSIRTRCSLQYAAVGNGILHTGGKHLHGRTNVCFYDFRLDFETVTTVQLVFCAFHFFFHLLLLYIYWTEFV